MKNSRHRGVPFPCRYLFAASDLYFALEWVDHLPSPIGLSSGRGWDFPCFSISPPLQQPLPSQVDLPSSITQTSTLDGLSDLVHIDPRGAAKALTQTHSQPVGVELELLLDVREGAGAVCGLVHARERPEAEVFAADGFWRGGGVSSVCLFVCLL